MNAALHDTFTGIMGVVVITYVWQAAVWASKRWGRK